MAELKIMDRHVLKRPSEKEVQMELVLTRNGWERLFTAKGFFVGWYNPKVSGNKIFTFQEAFKTQNKIKKAKKGK